ncbi:MAG: hypothetical protein IID44_28655 [Planctomycetes bacterium]|nr:hypothetical protein [Planctomycetota bacterium]
MTATHGRNGAEIADGVASYNPPGAFCQFARRFATATGVVWCGPRIIIEDMDARRVLIPLFLLATVLVDLAVLWPSRFGGDAAPTILVALAGSQLSLAACYLVFGRAYILWRVVAVALVLGAWSLLAGWAGPLDAPPALVMGTIYVSIVGGALGIVRFTGGRAVGRRLRFSLDEVYTTVTLVCVAMGAAVNFDWRLPGDLLVPTIVWSGVMAMITAGCLGVLQNRRGCGSRGAGKSASGSAIPS